jgi:hypothetical protein
MKMKWSTKKFKSRLVLWTVLGFSVAVGGSLDPTVIALVSSNLEEILGLNDGN